MCKHLSHLVTSQLSWAEQGHFIQPYWISFGAILKWPLLQNLGIFDPLPLIYISRYFSHYSPSVRSWTSSKYGPNFSLALSLPPSLRWHMATSSRAGGLSKHKIQIPVTKYLKLTTKGGACCYLRWVARMWCQSASYLPIPVFFAWSLLTQWARLHGIHLMRRKWNEQQRSPIGVNNLCKSRNCLNLFIITHEKMHIMRHDGLGDNCCLLCWVPRFRGWRSLNQK